MNATAAGAQSENSPQFRGVVEVLAEAIAEHRIPGAAVGVLAGGREEHAVLGLASLASLRPVTERTRFQIASITKTYTAAAVWQLIERGALELDGRVRRYLPGLRLADEATAEVVTVRNLLEHTAGWFADEVIDDGTDDDGELARYVDEYLPTLPQIFECGQFFSYSNSALQLLGRLVEVTTGLTFGTALHRGLIGPLGLDHTTFDRSTVLDGLYADGHTAMPVNGRDAVLVQTPVWLPRSVDPAGGLWSTTRDVLRYARMHWGEPALLKPATLQAMQEPAVAVPGLGLHMGRSWFVQEVDGVRAISHDGDTFGQHAVLLIVPEHRFAFVVMLNGQSGAEAALAALDAALSAYPDVAPLSGKVGLMRSVLAADDAEPVPVAAGKLREYEGRYVDPGQTTTLSLATGESGPVLQKTTELTPAPGAWRPPVDAPPAEPLDVRFLAPDLAAAGGWRMPFVRDRDGEVGWIADGLRLRPRA